MSTGSQGNEAMESMQMIIERIRYWGQLLLLPVYWFSFLFPRNRKIWLFGSTFGRRFADNPRYFYLYVNQSEECRDIRAIWISHNKEIVEFLQQNGYEAYYYHSWKGIWYCLRGKVYLFDNYSKDISFWLSGGATKVNMWHGVPLKKIQHDNVFDRFRHPKNVWEKIQNYPRNLSDEKPSHYVLATSEFMKPIFASAFQTKHVLTTGYPRVDSFAFDHIKNLYTAKEQQLLQQIEQLRQDRDADTILYYMPTFRDSETQFFDVMNLETFGQYLQKNHMLFCAKLHPKSKLKKEFEAIQGGNIVCIDADVDPYVFVPIADVLVTDYSSIYFDYLFTRRPIVYFDYDLREYLEDSREMYFDYEEYTVGTKAENQNQLEDALSNAVSDQIENQNKADALLYKMFDEVNQPVSGRLVKEIRQMIEDR